MEEPDLEVDDIQGHVLVGFGYGYQEIVGFRFGTGSVDDARAHLLPLVDEITPARPPMWARALRRTNAHVGPVPDADAPAFSLSFSHEGLQFFGAFAGPDDVSFRRGAAGSAAALKDDVDGNGRPLGWDFGFDADSTPHVLAVVAAATSDGAAARATDVIGRLAPAASVVFRIPARRFPGDREHFGFVDGISQPAPRGLVDGRPFVERAYLPGHPDADAYARPGQPLVWPGQFVFGYPSQDTDAATPGPTVGDGVLLLRNGSLLVFRKLRQNVSLFRAATGRLAAAFTAVGVPIDTQTAAAWCVGRWPDGTPVSLSPRGEALAISGDPVLRNGFKYRYACEAAALTIEGRSFAFPGASNDPFGRSCPFFAHIRKVNPRDVPVEQGSNSLTLKSQMLRRGVPYGPAWSPGADDVDRGLLFMSYQTSIENQFEHLMTAWVNSAFAPPMPQGIDPLIGAPPPGGRLLTRRPDDDRNYRAIMPERHVTATGAGYFFAPGISATRQIVGGIGDLIARASSETVAQGERTTRGERTT